MLSNIWIEMDDQLSNYVRGKILETMPGTKFKVMITLNEQEHEIIGYISGKMRMHYIKILYSDVIIPPINHIIQEYIRIGILSNIICFNINNDSVLMQR